MYQNDDLRARGREVAWSRKSNRKAFVTPISVSFLIKAIAANLTHCLLEQECKNPLKPGTGRKIHIYCVQGDWRVTTVSSVVYRGTERRWST